MSKRTLLIGAGNSGRGFLARLLLMDGIHITFADKDMERIEQLGAAGAYSVFVGEEQKEYRIGGYKTCHIESEEALRAAVEADFIMICIGSQHLSELAGFFDKLVSLTGQKKYKVIVCENGISPKTILQKSLAESTAEKMLITQGIIFCTSIPVKNGELDIISEDYPNLPVDHDEELFETDCPHFPSIKNFDTLMMRKLYTYNCISGCIAYPGYLKGYVDYGEAARDPEILQFCNYIKADLDEAVCRETNTKKNKQTVFSERAIAKFTSRVIKDTITKNARSVVRKIGPEERLMGPMKLFLKYGLETEPLCCVVAAALCYLEREESSEYQKRGYHDPFSLFLADNPSVPEHSEEAAAIKKYYEIFRKSGFSYVIPGGQ